MILMRNIKCTFIYFFVFFTSCINFIQLEISSGNKNIMPFKYIVLNILTITFLGLLFIFLTRKFWLGNILCGLSFSVLALLNYYIIEFRSMPLTTQDIGNLRTALNVSGSYGIHFSIEVCYILLIALVIIIFSLLIKKIEIMEESRSHKPGLVLLILLVYMYFGYFSNSPIKPPNVLKLSWTEGYHEYGFISCSVEIFCKSIVPLKKIQGYKPESIEDIVEQYSEMQREKNSSHPDIILILNETFYDLDLITELDCNIDVTEPLKSYDIIHGYSCVQVTGGGTSISEYELLTSNSMHLLYGITPFNSLEFKNSNSIVSYLKAQGYYTLGAHPESDVNYSRGRVYPKLGFDIVKFKEDFSENEYYGSRNPANGGMNLITDSSAYKNLIEWYEQMPEKNPRFCYILTMQNHGPYDFLEEHEQIVHSNKDYGEYNSQVDEYLSCVYKSYEAFAELIKYYKNIERDVIICMVGDHAPAFSLNIADRSELSEIERDLKLSSTPFLIWSNQGLEPKEYEPFSLIYLIPVLLNEADIVLSPYYQYMLDIKDKVPVLTQLDHYFDDEYTLCSYLENNEYVSDEIKNYFFMEYNNISGKDRIEDAFFSK